MRKRSEERDLAGQGKTKEPCRGDKRFVLLEPGQPLSGLSSHWSPKSVIA